MYRMRSCSRRVFITRNGSIVEITGGDVFTATEFSTLFSDAEVVCIDENTDTLHTVAAKTQVLVSVPVAMPVVNVKNVPDKG